MKTTKTTKAIVMAAMVTLFSLATTSCNKTYDCHCTLTAGGDEETEIKAKSKSDAESDCKAKQTGSTKYKDCHLD